MSTGRVNPAQRLEHQGISDLGQVHYNLLEPALIQAALTRNEGRLGNGGTLLVSTGKYTGRSPKDKFVVATPSVEPHIWWDNNARMEMDAFDRLYSDMVAHMKGGEYFVQDLYAGADADHRLDVRVISELAWHNLFIRHLLRRPSRTELDSFVPEFTIINCPSFKADPAKHGCRTDTVIALNFDKKLILIGGTEYAGENKKSVFTLLNYLLPEKGVMPMHCSANHATGNPDDSAVFFGLSGTGKTTLSADPARVLIGDDEHGWSENGIFNFEGGCYAKTINLRKEAEPEIYATTHSFGTVIENMVYDEETLELDFDDASLTANTRCAYPLEQISNASDTGLGGHPKNIIMLTCDAFGVLPPIARLTPAQAMYHFLSGFTSKVAGTERGVTEPEPTFSTCFGAPFMPRPAGVYAELLMKRIEDFGSKVYLVNTGWTGGSGDKGTRFPIPVTRAVVTAITNGDLESVEIETLPTLNLAYPKSVPGVDDKYLNPKTTWSDPAAYDAQARKLAELFVKNFEKFDVSQQIVDAGPTPG